MTAYRRMILFIARGEPNSMAAVENLQRVRDRAANIEFDLQLIDVLEQYETALEHNVLVTPCLILVEPLPRVMIAGTLKDAQKVRTALRLERDPHD